MHKVYCFSPTEYFGSNTYLIESNGRYAVIDPSVDFEQVFEQHNNIRGNLDYILLTHAHFDHILKINSWAAECKQVFVGDRDKDYLSDPSLNCYLGFLGVEDGYFGEVKTVSTGSSLMLGDCRISVIECPGHTPGGVGYIIEDSLFIGDTLFADGGYGRCDLPGGDINVLADTLGRLFACEEDYVLYPGHGKQTTLKETKKFFV